MNTILFEGDGIFVLGQEQDLLGSGFNEAESFMGYLSNVAMWDYILQGTDVWYLTMLCGVPSRAGNIFIWTDFLGGIHGDLKV
jgi:CUB/sushi domain-containing protein